MKKLFDEEVRTESRYNKVPEGMSTKQVVECNRCNYRVYYMQVNVAKEEAWKKGGSSRDYLSGFYMQPIPECKRRTKCLVSGIIIRRAAKAASSFFNKKVIKPETSILNH